MSDKEYPWAKLEPGGTDARRVLTDGRFDFFWIITGRREPGLLLQLPAGFESAVTLPIMRNLHIAFLDVGAKPALLLLLRDKDQTELFETLCWDIVEWAEKGLDVADAVARMIRRTMRWHHLLRGGRSDKLSPEEQRGLIGELHFLRVLMELLSPLDAIQAWTGPAGSAKDFEMGTVYVEVKARRGAAHPHVQISSEAQLSDVDGARLFLRILAVDTVPSPHGMTLANYVDGLEALFAQSDFDALSLWEQALADTGFDHGHDYSDRNWIVGPVHTYEVTDGFPRIATPVPSGVSNVRYNIAIDACQPFAVDEKDLHQLIAGRVV